MTVMWPLGSCQGVNYLAKLGTSNGARRSERSARPWRPDAKCMPSADDVQP